MASLLLTNMNDEHLQQIQEIRGELRSCTTDMGRTMNTLDGHVTDNSRHVEGVRIELQVMRENHLTHIQRATEIQAEQAIKMTARIGEMETLAAVTKTNLDWLMRYHWIIATSSIGALVASLLGLILK